MLSKYSYLDDELAVSEIRKHQWIQSEKEGKEIGFATAAVDWINRYGYAWTQFRLSINKSEEFFSEKRRYRRLSFRFPIRLEFNETSIATHTHDISLIGFSCCVPNYYPDKTPAKITICFQNKEIHLPQTRFHYDSRIARITIKEHLALHYRYWLFFSFNEQIRDFLRLHSPSLQRAR